jgi:neutral ceramidase
MKNSYKGGKIMDLKAGVSKRDITPKRPAWLAGYASRNKPSEDIHDPLFMTAIVFDDGKTRLAMVSTDLCFIPLTVKDQIAHKIQDELSISPDHLIMASTHTHSGPVTSGKNLDTEWLESLANEIFSAINEAISSMVTVKISVGIGKSDVGVNRRERLSDGQITLGHNEDGFIDRQVGVISICSESGDSIATLINYGCHGTVLGPGNYLISADYMGSAVSRIQNDIGGVVTFFNSAPGNVDPFYRVGTNFEYVEELGEKLAIEVKRVLSEKMIEAVSTPIYVISTEVGLPLKTPLEDGNHISVISTSIVRIGNIQFVMFPGEMFAETGLVLKARSSARFPFIISYFCGKSAGYLPVRSAYQFGGYEVNTSRHSFDAEEVYVNVVSRLIS